MSEVALPASPALPPSHGSNARMVRIRASARAWTRSTWVLFPAVFLIAAGGTFLLEYLRTGPVIASTPRVNSLLGPGKANLDLRVETQGLGVRLSWNPSSPAALIATSGRLEIDDSLQHRSIELDRAQILNGFVVYRPVSDDVSFRLSLHTGQGPDIAQVLRVLDASPHRAALDVFPQPSATAPLSKLSAPSKAEKIVSRESVRETPQPIRPLAHSAPSTESRAEAQHSAPSAPPASFAETAGTAVSQSTPPLSKQEITVPKPAQAQPQQLPAVKQPIQQTTGNAQPAASSAPTPALSKPVPAAPVPAYVPPRPLKWVQPDQRLDSTMPVDITVKVKIDETGHVTSAHALITTGKRDKKLMSAAAAAVRQWRFEPAKSHGVNVPSEETIVVHLGPESQ